MDKNTITGLVLIGLVLIGFSWYNSPTQEQIEERKRYYDSIQSAQIEQKAALEAEQAELNKPLFETSDTDSAKMAKAIYMYGDFAEGALGDVQNVVLENNVAKVTFSSKGAVVESVVLKDYQNYKKEPLTLFEKGDSWFSIELPTNSNRSLQTADMNFKIAAKTDSSVVFSLPVADGRSLDFIYVLHSDDYMVDFDVKSNGLSDVLQPVDKLKSYWKYKVRQQEKGRKFENRYSQIYYYLAEDEDYEYLSETSSETEEVSEKMRWIAFIFYFFSSVFIADKSIKSATLSSELEPEDSEYLKSYSSVMELPYDGGNSEMNFRLFFGPNKYSLLKKYDKGVDSEDELNLQYLIPLGISLVSWINKLITIPLFNFLGSFISNYGIIILLLTIVIKLLIFPLTYKSYMSTAKMKVLRPQIEEINQRIPQDRPTERSQATMELYSKAGVNPMGGCLPMLLQMPFLIALFYFFPTAIELRGESFLWADDLSSYDAIVSWNAHIPFISNTFGNHISLFCLLMTITNIIYTKVNMSMTDTGQMNQMPFMKYMMYFMPLMFLFIFNDYASGLSYYYFVSLLITILQTYIIRKFFVDEEKLLAQIKEKQKQPRSKSSWLSRLEEMQKQQMEMQKQMQEQNKQNKK